MTSTPKLKLPRQIEMDPRREAVERALAQDLRPLWAQGVLPVSHVRLEPPLEKALIAALVGRHLERGLEHIEELLAKEELGLAALREKQGAPPSYRVSRLLLVADDGAERFYRMTESALLRHGDRLLGLRVLASPDNLARNLFGPDKLVKAVLVSDRDAVSQVLLSLIPA